MILKGVRPQWAKVKPFFLFYTFLMLTCVSNGANAQSAISPTLVYDSFDSIIGEQNMELYSGPLFQEEKRNIKNTHPYFLERGFLNGDVVFDGQPYFDQNLKYHQELDQLLITSKYSPTGLIVRLIEDKVQEFTINGHRFVRFPSTKQNDKIKGYLEVIETVNGNMLLKKYKKKAVESRKESKVVTEFEEHIDYVLYIQDKLLLANTKKHWSNTFNNKKQELRDFYKQNRITYRSDKDTFFKLLLNTLTNHAE